MGGCASSWRTVPAADLVVGGGEHLAQFGAGYGAADRHVHVRGQALLRFDGGEVLQVVAEEPAQVLDQPVEQRGEVQRVPGGAAVVVGVRAGRCAVCADLAVAVARQREEHGRPEPLAVWRGVGLADRPGSDWPPGQVRGVLAAPGRAVPPGAAIGQDVAAQAGSGDFLVQLGGQLVQLAGVVPGGVGLVALLLGLGAVLHPHPLLVVGRAGGDDGLCVEVPALPALRRPQCLGPFGARRADGGKGVPAWHEYLFGLPGVQVGAAQLYGADAAAVGDGQVADGLAGQWHGQPLCPGLAWGHSAS
jgi:hypothetical protein